MSFPLEVLVLYQNTKRRKTYLPQIPHHLSPKDYISLLVIESQWKRDKY